MDCNTTHHICLALICSPQKTIVLMLTHRVFILSFQNNLDFFPPCSLSYLSLFVLCASSCRLGGAELGGLR